MEVLKQRHLFSLAESSKELSPDVLLICRDGRILVHRLVEQAWNNIITFLPLIVFNQIKTRMTTSISSEAV